MIDERSKVNAAALTRRVIPWENAVKEAAKLDTESLAHRLGQEDLTPPLTHAQLRAYNAEAERRIHAAESALGGAD